MQSSKDTSPLRRFLARKSRRKDEPEKKPAALDAAGFDKLEASLNELSKAAATQSLTYLLLWLYLFFTVTAVTDYDLLIENPIKLPIFNLEIGLLAFFIAAPPLFWLVQLYMVRKLAVIGEAVDEYLTAAKQQAESAGADAMAVLERLRHRADGFVITRLLTRFDDIVLPDGRRGPPSSDLAFALTVLAAGATLVVAPLLLYFGFQIRFLAHQTEWITWWHRGWVLAGLVLCGAAGRTAKLSWGEALRALLTLLLHLVGLVRLCRYLRSPSSRGPARLARPLGLLFRVAPVAVLGLASLTVLTFPGETMSKDERLAEWGLGGRLAVWAGVPRTLTPKAAFDREAVAEALGDGAQPGKLDNAGPRPLDLRHRDFYGRNLIGIDLAGAWLQGANLTGAKLRKAKLGGAVLLGASLANAEAPGTYLGHAQLQGADLSGAELQGSDLMGANLQGANLEGTQLQGSSLWMTHLEGANLAYAHLIGTFLVDAKLIGSNIFYANLQGAYARNSQFEGANLDKTSWWRTQSDGMQVNHIYFISQKTEKYEEEPDSPEKFRPLAQKWLKNTIVQPISFGEEIFYHITKYEKSNKDEINEKNIHDYLYLNSQQSRPKERTIFLINMACRHSYGKFMLPHIIIRSHDNNDVSAAVLSDSIKDTDSCPAAKGLTADDWERLASNVEREKAAAAPR
jgi:hypothetical protein